MKSMCQEARRNSPSVAAGNPTDSCIRTTSRIAPSSTVRNPSSDIRPAAWSALARCRRPGRSRLPTWSPRKGGRSRIVMRSFYLVVGSGGPTRPPFGYTGPGPRLLRTSTSRKRRVGAGSGAVGHPTPAPSRRSTLGWQTVTYVAADNRYESLRYRRCGRSGLLLPPLSLGLWHNFGGERPLETQRAIVRRAFDLGITHFDLANNYGPPYGSAEENFGRLLSTDLGPYRDELVISTKAGYDMWPGPYGDHGSRKYLLASLDQSLGRMGLDYVDIFYSHRFDPDTPLEETMGALDAAVRAG